MPSYIHEKHDIGFLRSDGTTKVGLMLAREQGEKPLYRTLTERYLKNQYYAGSPDYGALDPQSEIAIILDDWRSGFGLEVYDSSDPKRYYSSIGMDLGNRGEAIAGWTPTAIALDSFTALTIVNADMELNSTWTTESGTWAQSNVQAHGGTYSWRASGGIAAQIAYQNLTWGNKFRNTVIEFKCWVYCTAATSARIGIDDGVGTTNSSYHTGVAGWEQLTVKRQLNASATRLGLEFECAATDGYFDDASLSEEPISDKPLKGVDFNDEHYIPYGNILAKMNAAGTAFSAVYSFPANITSLCPMNVNGTDYLFIALGTSNAYWYMSTAEAFTQSTLTNKTYQFFEVVETANPTLYGNGSGNTIRSTVNPLNGGTQWSDPATIVDSTYYDITDLIAWRGALYIMKEDKPYYLDSTGNVQSDLARELESEQKTTSGKNAWVHKNLLYIPCGDQSLLETDGTTNTWRNPSDYCTNLSDFVGRVFAGAGDGKYNYIIVDNSTKVEILKGRLETIDGTTSWVWHPTTEITLAGCEAAWISTVYQKRLWIASTLSTDSLYYLPLPGTYGNITSDANRLFKTDTYFITPWLHGNFKGENKRWVKVVATLGHANDTNIYFECWYQKKEDSTWTDAGDFKGSATTRVATLYLPVDASSNKPISPMMRFKIVAKTNVTTTTPELLSLDIRAILRPPVRQITEMAIRCQDGILDKFGKKLDGTDAAYIRTVLNEARDGSDVFTWYDVFGTTRFGIILPNEQESEMQRHLKGENPELYYFMRVQEVPLS